MKVEKIVRSIDFLGNDRKGTSGFHLIEIKKTGFRLKSFTTISF